MELRYLIKRIWQEQPRRFALSVVALAFASVLEGLALAAVVPLLQLVQSGGQAVVPTGKAGVLIGAVLGFLHLPFNLATVVVFILALLLVSQLTILGQAKVLSGSVARFDARLRMNLYRAITEADWSFFVSHKASDLTTALTYETGRASNAYSQLVQLLGTIILVLVYLVLALALSWPMTLIIAVAAGLILLVLRPRVNRGSAYGRTTTDLALEMYAESGEHIAGAKTVKAYSVEEDTVARYDSLVDRLTHVSYKVSMNQAWLQFFFNSISVIAVFLGIYLAVVLFGMSIPALMVFLLVFYRVSPRISNIQALQTQVLSFIPGLRTVDETTVAATNAREVTGDETLAAFNDRITFDRVSFDYHEEAHVLHEVTIEIPKGKTVAIVGPSGSGKTTAVDLLLGLIRPTGGRVVVDETLLDVLNLSAWRKRIGYVAQDSSFFHDTVRQNIRFGCLEATDAEVEAAAKLAFADAFIAELPEGYDTIIGDRGVRLSGGQRQRLALARAIVRTPDILVLDEATSALDAESEQKIQLAVDQLANKMTIVIVTHRFATVRNADVIHFLEDGHVIESGSWAELIAKNGRFAAMQGKQSLA